MILGHLGDAIAAYGMWAFFTIVIPGFILFKLSKIFIRSAKRILKRITRAFKTKDVSRVKRWAQKNYAIPLDFEQAAAVGSSAEKNILTVARAGSGKTRVLTTRALWLIDNCKIEPSQILLLAFNNTAVAEIEKRLQKNLGNEKIPHVMTFHALATAIVKPTEELLVDDKIGRQSSLSKKVASILHSNDLKESLWKFQSARFRADFSKIQESEIEENDELEVSTNDKGIILEGDLTSLDGTFVKSRGEQAISNVLFQNDIKYEYEKNFGWDGSSYRPDFTVSTGPDSGLIIEYFGLVKDPDYRNQIEEKRKYWKERPSWKLVEIYPQDLAARGEIKFTSFLLNILSENGVPHRTLSEEEIKTRKPEELPLIDPLRSSTSFINRTRNLGLSPMKLKSDIQKHSPWDQEEEAFLDLISEVYERYLKELKEKEQEDFNGLLWRSTEKICKGGTRFHRRKADQKGDLKDIRYVLVDEFQDFSIPFQEILNAIKKVNPSLKIFAVGDDWQAINGFAGSNLKFFNDFKKDYKDSVRLEITSNYRSSASIVKVSNLLMESQESFSSKPKGVAISDEEGEVNFWNLSEFESTKQEKVIYENDARKAAVLRLISWHSEKGRAVVLLSRTNKVRGSSSTEEYLDELCSEFSDNGETDFLSISTTHSYKGSEAPAVIILDADSYPLIHDDWKFQRILGDSLATITNDERRLLYVALTRAELALDVLCVDPEKSKFLKELTKEIGYSDWDSRSRSIDATTDVLQIRVRNRNNIGVKEILRRDGFHWDRDEHYWYKKLVTSEDDYEYSCGNCDSVVAFGDNNCPECGAEISEMLDADESEDFPDLEEAEWFRPGIRVSVVSSNGEVVWERQP